jgi:predicted PurR-regulated permease PerM
VLALLLGAALGLWVLYRVRSVLLLLVLAVFFAYLVAPLVRVLRRPILRGRSLPLPLAIGVTYVVIFGSLAVAAVLLLPILNQEIAELGKQAPGYLARAQDQWRVWQAGYPDPGTPRRGA